MTKTQTTRARWTLHRVAARWVWWRTGFTHWSSGPSGYTYDHSCPLCRLLRLIGKSP